MPLDIQIESNGLLRNKNSGWVGMLGHTEGSTAEVDDMPDVFITT